MAKAHLSVVFLYLNKIPENCPFHILCVFPPAYILGNLSKQETNVEEETAMHLTWFGEKCMIDEGILVFQMQNTQKEKHLNLL